MLPLSVVLRNIFETNAEDFDPIAVKVQRVSIVSLVDCPKFEVSHISFAHKT